jgi:flagellar motor switch protein FliG
MPDPALTGPQKAVIMLLSMGEERATEVLRHLPEAHMRQLAEALDSLQAVSQTQVDTVFQDFEVQHDRYALALGSGSRTIRRMAHKVLGPERADDLLAREVEQPQPLRLLNRIEPETLAGLLGKEHAQALAALLAHVEVDKAAAVLSHLPSDVQVDVVQRMANLEAIPQTTIFEAERVLRDELALVSEAKVATIDGLKRAAELVSRLDGEVSERMLAAVHDTDEDLAIAIKRSMFTFEDLLKIDNRDMQTVLKEVSTEQLRTALKTVSETLRDHILSAMSRRAAEMLLDDLEGMGPVKLSVVEESQAAIVEVALKLQGEGKINIMGVGGEEMV